MRFLFLILAVLGCLFLNSCIDVREEIWIERDGSGRAILEYVIPSSALELAGGEEGLRAEAQRIIDSLPDLHLDEFTVTPANGDSTITLKASTNSMLSLLDAGDNEVLKNLPKTTTGFAGAFDVKLDGLVVDFKREINLKEALGFASLAISSSQRQKRSLHYIIHLPAEASTHNATETENGGQTLIWKYPLSEALTSPISTDFRVRIPVPWWVFAGAGLLVAFFLWVLVKIWKRRRRRTS
ncbi:hypothetical protein [Haloferula sp.]|uniref:hypothetical protein n=1 Tax=Haloferula sp. TaxID=2497595 RepID=UPI00329DF709